MKNEVQSQHEIFGTTSKGKEHHFSNY